MDLVTFAALLVGLGLGTFLGHAAGFAKGIERGARWIATHPARPETTDSETSR